MWAPARDPSVEGSAAGRPGGLAEGGRAEGGALGEARREEEHEDPVGAVGVSRGCAVWAPARDPSAEGSAAGRPGGLAEGGRAKGGELGRPAGKEGTRTH